MLWPMCHALKSGATQRLKPSFQFSSKPHHSLQIRSDLSRIWVSSHDLAGPFDAFGQRKSGDESTQTD
ncbi:MAG: hypothetical protein CMP97_12970 [Gammaproteobacteria bacterium]|nr:hypothetical protein [Gammaproteobacteria bacterium]